MPGLPDSNPRLPSAPAGRIRSAGATAKRAALFLSLAWGAWGLAAGCSGNPPRSAGPLAGYPPSPALDAVKVTHAEAATDRDQRLLLVTWFPDGDPNVAQVCSVLPDGHVNTYRFIFNTSLEDSRKRDLTGEQVAALKEDLDALPASQSPPLHDLLILSFRHGEQWVSRTYDRANRPRAVSDLFTVTGAPIDPPR